MVNRDPRAIEAGLPLLVAGYCDQPYVVRYDDGEWLAVVTTADEHEGDPSQRIVSLSSRDQGGTWRETSEIEPAEGPEASWAMPLLAGERLFVFYTYNSGDLREVPTTVGMSRRVDTLGDMVFRFSDDRGTTWSERSIIPIRRFEVDRQNDFGGEPSYWWGVGKPEVIDGAVYIGASKVGHFEDEAIGFQAATEGFLLRSDDLLSRSDPETATWVTLPEGDRGIRAPEGTIAEEHKVVGLPGGGLVVVFRTEVGYLAQAYSNDRGATWSDSTYVRFVSGAPVKHPRAAGFVWDCGQGRYLLWFHNNSNTWFGPYRNPAWLAAGRLVDGELRWSEPEIGLFADDPLESMSYPDLVIDGDRWFLTETQKRLARVHEVPAKIVQALFGEVSADSALDSVVAQRGQDGTWRGSVDLAPLRAPRGNWRFDDTAAGFTVELALRAEVFTTPGIVCSTRQPDGAGWSVTVESGRRLRLTASDGRLETSWTSDPVSDGDHHFCFIVDGGARLILSVVDGVLQDGGVTRKYGWGRLDRELRSAAGQPSPVEDSSAHGMAGPWRIHSRALLVNEAAAIARQWQESH